MSRIRSSLPILLGGVALVAALALRTEPRPQARTHARRPAPAIEEAPPAPAIVRVAPPVETPKVEEKREEEPVRYECGSAPVALVPVLPLAQEEPDQGLSEEASSSFCTVSR